MGCLEASGVPARFLKVKVSRWKWDGHVAGMDGGRKVMELRKAKPGGGTNAWKARVRRMDNVELDLMTMGVKRRRTRIWTE